jgi:hypothetical protein
MCLRGPSDAARLAALLAGLPFLPLLPLVTGAVFLHEQLFARRHDRGFRAAGDHGCGGSFRCAPLGGAAPPRLAAEA